MKFLLVAHDILQQFEAFLPLEIFGHHHLSISIARFVGPFHQVGQWYSAKRCLVDGVMLE